jgi:hypothetical protein
MLSPDCRGFREEFTPGARDAALTAIADHRASCPACGAWAAAMERAARPLPLPERLRGRLLAIPEEETAGQVLQFLPSSPVPPVPLPGALAERLRAIPAAAPRPELPFWLRNSRVAIAASYFLAVVTVTALGNPAAIGRQAADTVTRAMRATVARAAAGRGELEQLETRLRVEVGTKRDRLESSLSGLGGQVEQISRSLIPSRNTQEPGRRNETPPPSRRPR